MAWPLMFDASTPPARAPTGYGVVAGYIGGHTPHIWTKAEWRRFPKLRKLPIYVPAAAVDLKANPADEAFEALRALWELGVPKRSPVVWDMETAVQPAQVGIVHEIMAWAGYRMWVYGSADFVFRNPAADGYWVADYTGKPFMYPHADVRATQYTDRAPGNAYDSSTVKPWQYRFVLKDW